jgi:molecular chaperone GrpE
MSDVIADSQSDPSPDATVTQAPDAAADPSPADGAPRVAALEAEVADLRDKHLRVVAEYDNYRKRAVKERQEAGWRAQGELVRGLLDALDDLSRFATVDPATVTAPLMVDGVAMLEKKIEKSLAGHGFARITPADQPFDPALHEAVGTAPAERPELDGTVHQVYQVGYIINGHVLRPARVVVRQWTGGPPASDAPVVH